MRCEMRRSDGNREGDKERLAKYCEKDEMNVDRKKERVRDKSVIGEESGNRGELKMETRGSVDGDAKGRSVEEEGSGESVMRE